MEKTSFNAAEVENFNALAAEWWDESGPMKPLHRLGPVRMQYLKNRICQHFRIESSASLPFKNLKMLDIGCGGGLVSEPLTRLGGNVTGVDAAAQNIKIAKAHAAQSGLSITYKNDLVENLLQNKTKYDVILALEILEHVEDTAFFLESCAKLLKKDGILIISTLNRNPKSFMLGIVAAEYLLRWVPRGTHNWKKFLKPSEIAVQLEPQGLKPFDVTGLVYNPISRQFSLSDTDLDVNYFMVFRH